MRDEENPKTQNNSISSFILHTSSFPARPGLHRTRHVLPLFLIVIAALIFFGRVLYVKIALDMASYDACRAAVEALRPGDGISQGLVAGRETLRGFYLNPAGATVAISPAGGWARGTPVQCIASYDLFVGDIPGVQSFATGSGVPLQSTTWSRVELWRSDWR
jgi:hypothetical protein